MSLCLFVLVVCFLVLAVLGVPIGFTMGISTVLAVVVSGLVPLQMIPGRMVSSCESFVLLAIPYFILAGLLMDMAGVSRRLLNLALVLVGHFRGGLSLVVIVAEMFFSGISGSTVADVSAISAMALPSMEKAGYKPSYSVAVISAASAMGILIPPCINMIILGELMSMSVAALFFAGFLPAVVLALIIMGLVCFQARRSDIEKKAAASRSEVISAFVGAIIPLGLPAIMFGGILWGVITPTEAGAVAVLYSVVIGFFVYHELTVKKLWQAFVDTAVMTGIIMFLVAAASLLSYMLAIQNVPELILHWTLSITKAPWFFLVVTCLVFVFIGSALEGIPAMMIFVPIFMPVVEELRIDFLHYGILVIGAVGIGLFVPPAGVGLIVGCTVGKVSLDAVSKKIYPFLIALLAGLGILIYFPKISTIVPYVLGLQ